MPKVGNWNLTIGLLYLHLIDKMGQFDNDKSSFKNKRKLPDNPAI